MNLLNKNLYFRLSSDLTENIIFAQVTTVKPIGSTSRYNYNNITNNDNMNDNSNNDNVKGNRNDNENFFIDIRL